MRQRYVPKRQNHAIWIVPSVVLLVVALVLFVMARKESREDKLRRMEQEIARGEDPVVDPTEKNRVVGTIVAEKIEDVEEKEAAAAAAAVEKEKQKKKRRRQEIRNLPHLDETSEELRTEIDELVATATDLSLTVEANRARQKLLEIRRPAIPRLLNRFEGLDMSNIDHIQIANIVHRTMFEMTAYDRIVFSPMGEDDRDVALRRAAMRQWFQWWGDKGEAFE